MSAHDFQTWTTLDEKQKSTNKRAVDAAEGPYAPPPVNEEPLMYLPGADDPFDPDECKNKAMAMMAKFRGAPLAPGEGPKLKDVRAVLAGADKKTEDYMDMDVGAAPAAPAPPINREAASRKRGLETPLDASNKGFEMLQKMGYEGGGLGKDEDGMVDPLPTEIRKTRDARGIRIPRRASMDTIWTRLLQLELRAQANGLQIDYAANEQNGHDCWFVATLLLVRRQGLILPVGVTVRSLRARTRDWLVARSEQYRMLGEEYWSFVSDWERAYVTSLAAMGALSVLSGDLEHNLEMVALCTTGSDYLTPLCSTPTRPEWPDADQLVYGFDPEKHYVACVPMRPLHQNCVAALGQVAAHTFELLRAPALPSLVPITDR